METSTPIGHRKALAVVATVCLALTIAIPAAFGAGPTKSGTKRPKAQKVSLLYVVGAASGRLQPKGKGHYTLTLKAADRDAVWFSDRPSRRSGSFPTADLPAAWAGFGFDADPPNAALSYTDPDGTDRTAILELSRPRYAKGSRTIGFDARVLDPRSVKPGDLAARASSADRTPAPKLADVSLFIDDTEAPVIGVCVMQPHVYCPESLIQRAELDNIDLTGGYFHGASFLASQINGTEFTEANLTGAEMQDVFAQQATFAHADLAGADLFNGFLVSADFEGANLEGANLGYAEVGGTNFKGANLNGVSFTGVHFCGTTMPDGSVNNSGCGVF